MSLGYLDSQKLTNIADAIRTKAGTSGTMTVDEMPTNIVNIPTGTPLKEKDVTFYDYDGTILYSYSLAEANALQTLPTLPEGPEGYTAASWTETLSFIQNLTHPMNIGVNYTTTRSDTWLYVTLGPNDLEVYLYVYTRQDGSVINWGDGTSTTVSIWNAHWESHTYSTPGDYIIKTNQPLVTGGNYPVTTPLGSANLPCPVVVSASEVTGVTNRVNYRLLRKIEVGSAVTQLADVAKLSINLESIILPSTNAYLDATSAFYWSSLKHLTINSGMHSLASLSILNACLNLESVVIPSTMDANNGNVTISLSDNATTERAVKIKKVILPDSFTGKFNTSRAFCGLSDLEYFYAPKATAMTSELLSGPNKLKHVSFPKMTQLHNYTFNGSPIESVTLGSDLTLINQGAFQGCRYLSSIDLSGTSVTSIGNNAFDNCCSLKSVILPSTLTTLGSTVFQASGLETITIPANVTSIGSTCFRNCSFLSEVHMKPTTPPTLGNNAFLNTPLLSAGTIYVPQGHLNDYQTTSGWSTYASIMVEE